MATKKSHLEITTTTPVMLKIFLEDNFSKMLTFKVEFDPNYIQPKPNEVGKTMWRFYITFSKYIKRDEHTSFAFTIGMNWQTEKNKYNYLEA